MLPIVFIVVFGSMFKFGPDQRQAARRSRSGTRPAIARGEAIAHVARDTPGFAAAPRARADEVRRAVATEEVVAGLVIPVDRDAAVELVIDLGAPHPGARARRRAR